MKEICNLIVKEEGICIYRQPIYPPMSRKQAQSFAILCEDQERATQIILNIEQGNLASDGEKLNIEMCIGGVYPVPGIEFEVIEVNIKWPKPPSSPADIKTVARLIEHTAEKESPEIDEEEEQLIWKHIYIDFRDGEGWINFAERMSQQFTIKTRKP